MKEIVFEEVSTCKPGFIWLISTSSNHLKQKNTMKIHEKLHVKKKPICRFPKMGDPQVTIGFNTKSWSNDLDDLGVPPWLRKPPNWINAWYAVTRPKTSAQNIPRPQNVIRARALVSMPSVGERVQKMVTEIQGTDGEYAWKMLEDRNIPSISKECLKYTT